MAMSTVAEIEAAIEHLPASERNRLREKLSFHAAKLPKTGAELARLWPDRFHLDPEEADALAADMNGAQQSRPRPLAWE
jgi:hypothetical protein